MSAGIDARFCIRQPGFALDAALALPGRGITAFFGPSGSGKTSCLRAIAGLDRVAGGYVEVNGEVWQDDSSRRFVPPHRRSVGYVFQEVSLFPHLSVRGNLEFARCRALRSASMGLEQVVELMELRALVERRPDRLSGGERQRVAIARALLGGPRLLLLDEPLAALDASRKAEIIPFLERLHRQLAIPVIYVSHSAEEVFRLADFVVLLGHGGVIASGALQDVSARLDVAGAFADEASVVIETVVASHDSSDHLTRLEFPGGAIYVAHRPEPPGSRLRCRIQARDVSLILEKPTGTSILNLLHATVIGMVGTVEPAHVLVRLDAAGIPLLARITLRSWNELKLAPGQQICAQVKAAALLA